jgi:uncharacterized protein YndB with AHSA1/START domain
MGADRIEREIEIEAPIDVVWAVVTEPEHMAVWFSESAELDVRPGGEGRLIWQRKATNHEATVNVRVERVEPPHFFSFRWDYPDGSEPDSTNAPLVEFSVEKRGESTRLRLVESGLAGIERSDDAKETYFAEHNRGWDEIVARLREYAVEQRSAVAG